MQSYYSSNNSYRVDAHEDGHYSLNRQNPDFGIFIRDDNQMIELFGLLCQFITEHMLRNWQWVVSSSDQPDDNGTDWSEDDVPY
jgi:hypothetical protein